MLIWLQDIQNQWLHTLRTTVRPARLIRAHHIQSHLLSKVWFKKTIPFRIFFDYIIQVSEFSLTSKDYHNFIEIGSMKTIRNKITDLWAASCIIYSYNSNLLFTHTIYTYNLQLPFTFTIYTYNLYLQFTLTMYVYDLHLPFTLHLLHFTFTT